MLLLYFIHSLTALVSFSSNRQLRPPESGQTPNQHYFCNFTAARRVIRLETRSVTQVAYRAAMACKHQRSLSFSFERKPLGNKLFLFALSKFHHTGDPPQGIPPSDLMTTSFVAKQSLIIILSLFLFLDYPKNFVFIVSFFPLLYLALGRLA